MQAQQLCAPACSVAESCVAMVRSSSAWHAATVLACAGYTFWLAATANGTLYTCDTQDDGYAGTLPEKRKPNHAGQLGRTGKHMWRVLHPAQHFAGFASGHVAASCCIPRKIGSCSRGAPIMCQPLHVLQGHRMSQGTCAAH
jgi:hypothetical protein